MKQKNKGQICEFTSLPFSDIFLIYLNIPLILLALLISSSRYS